MSEEDKTPEPTDEQIAAVLEAVQQSRNAIMQVLIASARKQKRPKAIQALRAKLSERPKFDDLRQIIPADETPDSCEI